MTFGRKGLLQREQLMTKYKYTGEEAFVAGHFRVKPGEIVDGTHPAVAFGVDGLVKLEDLDVPEPDGEEAFTEEPGDGDVLISREFSD